MASKHPYKRAERVGDLLREVLSETLVNKVHHYGLENVAITGVRISDDLQHARVFYRVLDKSKLTLTRRRLGQVSAMLRREAGRQLRMRYTPELKFEYDKSLDYGDRIEALLASVRTSEEE